MQFQVAGGPDWIELQATNRPAAIELLAQPFPGVPTDLQAQFTAVLALARGRSLVRDAIFPRRFQHVPQLARMGARLLPVAGGVAIDGVRSLTGAMLSASDLRASAALVLAGLAARGRTLVRGLRASRPRLRGARREIGRTRRRHRADRNRPDPRAGADASKRLCPTETSRIRSGGGNEPAAGGTVTSQPVAFGLTRPGQSPRL